MNEQLRLELNKFIGRAAKATYAGGGGKVKSWRKDFKELEFSDGDWYYRDSYTGSLRSWGQEVVWYKNKPVWVSSYGGGMGDDNMDTNFATKTFGFLKQALSAGDKENQFQPRGPENFQAGDWKYSCKLDGDITKFSGHEYISQKDKVVFTHDFVGGLVVE